MVSTTRAPELAAAYGLRAAAGRELHDLVVALDPDAAGRKAAARV